MPNDFSSDSRCKALYRFENNLNDSKGGNNLTNNGGVTFTSSDKREGSYAADFENSTGQWGSIADSSLDAGFPLKSGDTTKKISVCFWIKPESSASYLYIVAKYGALTGLRSFAIVRNLSNLGILIGYNNGNSYEDIDTNLSLNNNEWYHVGVRVNGIAKTVNVRLFRVSNSTVSTYTGTFSNELYVSTADFTIGARHGGSAAYDGLLDEVVVFNDLLSGIEIDAIRSGTYSGPIPLIRAAAVGAKASYDPNPRVVANAVGAQASYDPNPRVVANAVGIQVAYSLMGGYNPDYVQANAAGVQVAYHPEDLSAQNYVQADAVGVQVAYFELKSSCRSCTSYRLHKRKKYRRYI